MFTRKEESTPTPESYSPPSTQAPKPSERPSYASKSSRENVISKGTRVQGDVFCEEDLCIEGRVNGNVYSKAKVTIGQTGLVEGKIECVNGEIHGAIKGTLTVQDQLSLRTKANINGDVLTAHLAMEPTVIFNGNCTMQDKITLPGPGVRPSMPRMEEKQTPLGNNPLSKPSVNKLSGNSPQKKNVEKERFSTRTFQR